MKNKIMKEKCYHDDLVMFKLKAPFKRFPHSVEHAFNTLLGRLNRSSNIVKSIKNVESLLKVC